MRLAVVTLAAAACTKDGYETAPRYEPVPVVPADAPVIVDVPPSTRPAIQLALGGTHSCALHDDGTVSCWGDNLSGQLGDGTQIVRELPVRVKDVTDVVEIAAHRARTCARKRDRSVWCWGDAGEHKPVMLAPVKIAVADAKSISGNCAVRESGAVVCWAAPPAVVEVAGVTGAVHIVSSRGWEDPAGGCAARADGRVICWTTPDSTRDSGIADADAVAVGFDFACAHRRDNSLTCWGMNGAAQLGRGTIDDRLTMRAPMPLGPAPVAIRDAVQVVAGHMHGCARTIAGRVACWGQRMDLESFFDHHRHPVDVGITGATALATGAMHACAIVDGGKVTCWGRNGSGQLGIGWSATRKRPTRVPGIDDAVQVVAGSGHTCARRRTGVIACWGDGDASVRAAPAFGNEAEQIAGEWRPCVRDRSGGVICRDAEKTERIKLDRKARDIAASLMFGCAIVDDGSVRCWGNNEYGMFGNGNTSQQMDRLGVQRGANGITDAVKIANGSYHACAIRASGEVWCWGDRVDDRYLTTSGSDLVPSAVPGITDAKGLALGITFTCALRATGKVACWGQNERGELGNGTAAPTMTPTDVSGLVDAVQIAAGGESVCARRETGRLVCWGRNVEGQLGDGAVTIASDPARAGRSTPQAVPDLDHVVDISTSGDHSCAVREDGSVWCWGKAAGGQVGTVVGEYTKAPVIVGVTP